jgi:hypothetical protein
MYLLVESNCLFVEKNIIESQQLNHAVLKGIFQKDSLSLTNIA